MTFKHILIALDESPISAHALDVAVSLAESVQGDIGFVYVIDISIVAGSEGFPALEVLNDLRQAGRDLFERATARLPSTKTAWQFLKEGSPAEQIVEAAREWGANLIVIGSHGRSGVPRLILGSVAEKVLHLARCPVLIVKAADARP
jgi:nucleotide-binding universal stress UspA family protein